MSAKDEVLKKYRFAYAYKWAGPSWTIYATRPSDPGHIGQMLGMGKTAALAWADALNNMVVKP